MTTREELRTQVESAGATELLPHQRRGALLVVEPTCDLLDVGLAIANDIRDQVEPLLTERSLYKPTLSQIEYWSTAPDFRFQFLILQPYVLAQPMKAMEPSALKRT